MDREDRIEKAHQDICQLTLQDLIKLNPTMDELRSIEYVRDIHYSHYPHHNLGEVEIVEKLLQRLK